MLSVKNLERPGIGPLSFELGDGECLAVRGASGSGKSLLLRALADLDPNRGDVRLDGQSRESVSAPEWRRRVTYLPAEPGWWAETVGAHFEDWQAARPLVEAMGLPTEARDWPVLRLSTGERQRLGLVRVLLLNPRVLLLDEPTSGLDPEATDAVETLLAERLRQGAAVLWVTHDRQQARRVAERVLEVRDGQVEEAAP